MLVEDGIEALAVPRTPWEEDELCARGAEMEGTGIRTWRVPGAEASLPSLPSLDLGALLDRAQGRPRLPLRFRPL